MKGKFIVACTVFAFSGMAGVLISAGAAIYFVLSENQANEFIAVNYIIANSIILLVFGSLVALLNRNS